MYTLFLENPSITTAYCLDANTERGLRLQMASTFLADKEYGYILVDVIDRFDLIENILKSKVLTYAIAFAGGAANGGTLYQDARRDLLTWRAIFEGARFVNGRLV